MIERAYRWTWMLAAVAVICLLVEPTGWAVITWLFYGAFVASLASFVVTCWDKRRARPFGKTNRRRVTLSILALCIACALLHYGMTYDFENWRFLDEVRTDTFFGEDVEIRNHVEF